MTICKAADLDPQVREEVAATFDPTVFADYREAYHKKFGKPSTLTNDQIIDLCARSDDDLGWDNWADFMLAVEEGTSDVWAEEYNSTLVE